MTTTHLSPLRGTALIILVLFGGVLAGTTQSFAVEGTSLDSSIGIWSPLLPRIIDAGGASDSGDSLGTILDLSGHHRFEGYRTSVEASVEYGIADDVELFAYDFILRDTWSFGIGDLSAGTGFSQMQWDRTWGAHSITSDYRGAKIIGGWEAILGRQPIWIDLTLGVYDFEGRFQDSANDAQISKVTSTWGIDVKADIDRFAAPMRVLVGVDYLRDMTDWNAGQIGTDEALALSAAIEIRLY